MNERYWEINGNLYDEQYGLENIKDFEEVIISVKNLYDQLFGEEVMNKHSMYIDNATADSGYTPIITVILRRYLIIKLSISSNNRKSKIAYQFGHELTHFVFYSYFGLDKPPANFDEEMICSAASLIVVKKLFPSDLGMFKEHVNNLSQDCYRKGLEYAESIDYDLENLKKSIINFKY